MSYTNQTANYGLPQYSADDKPTYLGDFNKAMLDIDTAIKANENIAQASETLAQNANNSASEALSTANTASSSATNAGVKADNAYALAESAKADATQATTDATDAKTIANSANQTATSANATATSAQTTATNANNTATSAQTTAQKVATDLENYMNIEQVDPSSIISLYSGYSFISSHLHKQGNHYFGYIDIQASTVFNNDGTVIGQLNVPINSSVNTGCFTGDQYHSPGTGSLFINSSNGAVQIYGSGNYAKIIFDLVVDQ